MNYADYINLKLQNFSREDLINFSINFARDTTGYIKDRPDNSQKKSQQNNNGYQQRKTNAISDTTKQLNDASKKAISGLDSQLSDSAKKNSFDPNKASQTKPAGSVESTKENKQAGTSPSNQQPSTQSTTQSNQNSSAEKATKKNYYGKDVDFEKRDGKWYRAGTNEVVDKTGKWRSYYDEKNGLKDAPQGGTKTSARSSKPKSMKQVGADKGNNPNAGKMPGFSKQRSIRKVETNILPENGKENTYVDKLGNVVKTTEKNVNNLNKENGPNKFEDANKVQERAKQVEEKKSQSNAQSSTQNNQQSKKGPIDVSNTSLDALKELSSETLKKYLDEGKIDKATYDKAMQGKQAQNWIERSSRGNRFGAL